MGGSAHDGGGAGGGPSTSCGRLRRDSNCEARAVCKCLLLAPVGGKGGSGMLGGGEGSGRDSATRGRGMSLLRSCRLVRSGTTENMLALFVTCRGGGGAWVLTPLLKGLMGSGVRVSWIVDSRCSETS